MRRDTSAVRGLYGMDMDLDLRVIGRKHLEVIIGQNLYAELQNNYPYVYLIKYYF